MTRYDLEIQLVHYREDFKSWEEAASTTVDAVFVISILYEVRLVYSIKQK